MLQQTSNEFQLLLKALGFVKTHWWLLLLEISIIYGYSLQRYYSATPEYRSSASILIDDSRRRLYQSFMGASSRLMNVRKQNVTQLLTSEEVMERFRLSLGDINERDGSPAHLKQFFPSGVALPTSAFRGLISLTWDEKSDTFTLSCSAENPDAAHDLCLAYMNTVEKYYPEIGQRDALMKREFLSRQLASVSRQIADAEIRLVEMQKENPDFFDYLLLDSEDQGRKKLQASLADLTEKMATNRATKSLLLKVPQAKRGEHTQLVTTIEALTLKLSDLQYRSKLTEQSDDPEKDERLFALKKEIELTANRLGRLNEQVVTAFVNNPVNTKDLRNKLADLEMDYRTFEIRRRHASAQMEELNNKEKKYSELKLNYKRNRSELDHKRRLLNNLYKLEQETELALSAGNSEIYRLREPSRNRRPVAPLLSRYLYGSLSICLFVLACTLILLMALFPRLDSEAEVNRLNLPVIGKVPHFKQGANRIEDIPSYAIEYLKIMNYRLLRETKEVKCPVIIVTSAHAREGKSTIINALTLTSQAPNRKSLLIDGDLLTNRPNQFFGISENQSTGLHHLLTSANPPNPHDLVVKTSEPGLSFLPRGERIDPNSLPQLLKPMDAVVRKLREEYDMIFIDSPPLFASNLAHQWAGLADLIVVVARIYVTRPRDVIEAIQTCKIYSKSPVGIALNCVPLSSAYRRASNYYFSKRKARPQQAAA
jgi:Mrp family chromosome partitioning ATPase